MSAKLQELLSRLDKCREVPTSKHDRTWSACCPAHDDKNPSFGVALCHDGKILMHCYAGCSIDEICFSLGVQPQDLFPEESNWKKQKYDTSTDELVVQLGDRDMAKGNALSAADKKRYREAVQRLAKGEPSPRIEPRAMQKNVLAVAEGYSKRTAERWEIIKGKKVEVVQT